MGAAVTNPENAPLEDNIKLSYETLYSMTEKHIRSFFGLKLGQYSNIIPKIVYGGLGLGYNIKTGQALDPRNHRPIIDKAVVFDSRVDRAMIEVAIKLKEYPQMILSSCTQLCDVKTPHADASGGKGIADEDAGIHGGLYPQSNIDIINDPIDEITAKTWIDEYAKLDRSELMHKSWDEWLKQGGEKLIEVMKKANGPFLDNTVTQRSLDKK
ncbi:hypothetical protein QBC38DRAFT_447913 [Podospora fimiseda]|uniref:Uncharacterized protein n=1 Tax=Podospora fimiseda TaxID=252190 RepID=A0AAN6YP24_9PEZI|nr:hypothetical protein QBC38DRAFT_447913 [Podospora fimiseda]